MSEYIYQSHGEPLVNERGEIYLARAGEVVRCRDCIGLVETWDGWECERFSGEYHRAEPDGFCSWGERRTDDN